MLRVLVLTVSAVCLLAGRPVLAAPTPSAAIASAVADPGRPDKDRSRDAVRKPAEMLAFAGVKTGDTVVDLLPGGGYFTRLFARVVGPKGRVYAVLTSDFAEGRRDIDPVATAYPNVRVMVLAADMSGWPAGVDEVWTAQNYHDLRGASETAAVNKAVFDALKPGGLYVVIDHAAAAGSGAHDVNSLHRIDQALVRTEVEAAGFRFDGESDALRNPADPRTAKVFDASIRGHTDQFALRFRKPN